MFYAKLKITQYPSLRGFKNEFLLSELEGSTSLLEPQRVRGHQDGERQAIQSLEAGRLPVQQVTCLFFLKGSQSLFHTQQTSNLHTNQVIFKYS